MNNDRRKQITAAIALIDAAFGQLEEARETIESIRDEEQEYFDAMPESFQNGDKGSTAQEAIDYLQGAIDEIENFDLSSITGSLDSAKG